MTTSLNMILGISFIIVIILLLRKILGDKCNPNIRYLLWIFVAVRILLPVEIGVEILEPESVAVRNENVGEAYIEAPHTDGDGVVYRITNMETGELTMMDKEEYQAWEDDLFKGAEEIKISWTGLPE